VGTGSGEVVQLDGSARLPAVSGRNLKELKGWQLLDETEVDVAANTVASYDFPSLGTFDQFYIELLGVGVDTDSAEVVLELYDGATLYGVGGTTGSYTYTSYWRRGTSTATSIADNSADEYILNPENWLFDSAAGGHESMFNAGVLITNNAAKFTGKGTHNQYPTLRHVWGDGLHAPTPGSPTQMHLWASHGTLMAAADIDGLKVRIDHGATAYFNNGFIRIWGLNGGLWTSGNERPVLS
jgi:hypothetical protein